MPRKRDPRRDEAFQIWKEHQGKITNRAIAKELSLPERTIGGWKSKDNWNGVLHKKERSTPNKKNTAKPRGRPKKSRKGIGNPHPVKEFTERNQAARKHGLFSRYMPKETLDIMKEISNSSPADLLWDQIMIQYSAIIRAQKIMHVEDAGDLSKEQSQSGWGDAGSDKYEIRFAYEKQAAFLNAQSKAIGELRSSIKQFVAIADEQDERRLKLELMQAQINKAKAEADRISGKVDSPGDYESDGFMDALDSKTDEVWHDD